MSDSLIIIALVDLQQLLHEAQLSTGGNKEILVFRRQRKWSQGVLVVELRVYGAPVTPKQTEIDEGDCVTKGSDVWEDKDRQNVLPTG